MKRNLVSLVAILFTACSLRAQTIILTTGGTIQGQSLKVSGDTVLSTVKMGNGEGTVGYAVATIAKIDFPKPTEMASAEEMLHDGKADLALAAIGPIVASQAPFRRIPGNWWVKAAAIKLSALSALRFDTQANALIAEMLPFASDPDTTQAIKLYQAIALSRKGQFQQAIALIDPILKEARNPKILATAWLYAGECRLGLKDYEPALLAYLHIPVFYPEEKLLMPASLLGAARALENLDDSVRAKASLDELLKDYGSSAEAALSKDDLKRIERKLKAQTSTTAISR